MELHFTAKFNSKLTCFTTKNFIPEERKEKKECWTFYTRHKQRKKKRKILDPGDQRHGNRKKNKRTEKKRERKEKKKEEKILHKARR